MREGGGSTVMVSMVTQRNQRKAPDVIGGGREGGGGGLHRNSLPSSTFRIASEGKDLRSQTISWAGEYHGHKSARSGLWGITNIQGNPEHSSIVASNGLKL